MDTHLLPSNREDFVDKQKLADARDHRKSNGICKTTLHKRPKLTKLNLKKYCGNDIKDRIKRSLQLRKQPAQASAGERTAPVSPHTERLPIGPAPSGHADDSDKGDNGTADATIDEKENHQPTAAAAATHATPPATQKSGGNRVIASDAPNVLVNRNIIATNCNRTHSNSIISDSNTTSVDNYSHTNAINRSKPASTSTTNCTGTGSGTANNKRRNRNHWPAGHQTSHSLDAYTVNAVNMSMYDYHYDSASNSTNGSNDVSTFYCTDLVTKQQLCDIALSMASLCNIGNSCYMNSVLYTLRFTPLFLHNLHHLVHDFGQIVTRREAQLKLKSSSLGRNVSGLQGPNSRSFSSKDLASLGAAAATATAAAAATSSASTSSTSSSTSSSVASGSAGSAAASAAFDIVKTSQQNAMEKLHDLFKSLTSNEVNETTEPYQSDLFLKAIQDVSPIFAGNQQQDAHEFLMCILDSIRESCQALTKLITEHPEIAFNSFVEQFERSMTVKQVVSTQPATEKKTNWFKRRKDDKNKIVAIESPSRDSNSFDSTASANDADRAAATSNEPQFMSKEAVRDKIKALGLDFFSKDFEGVTASSIQCLACETTTEQKETMIDLAVPITENMETNELSDSFIQNLCITRERFHGDNKFRCENCMGLTEAIRKISYPKLPRLLIIQLKRFSGGMEKINSYIPTPFTLQCFCSACISDHGAHLNKHHEYQLYSVITHVGSTLQAGHYIAYTSSLNQHSAFVDCVKDINRKDFAFLTSTPATAAPPPPPPTTTSSSSDSNWLMTGKSSVFRFSDGSQAGGASTQSSATSVMKKIGLGRKKSSSSTMDAHKAVKGVNGLKAGAVNGMDGTALGGSVDGISGQAGGASAKQPCPSTTCCAIKMKSHLPSTAYSSSNGNDAAALSNGTDPPGPAEHGRKANAAAAAQTLYTDQFYGSSPNSGNSHAGSAAPGHLPAKVHYEPIWYMCDDDKIKAIPQHEFREMLLPKKNMITPYLLFYARNDVFESQ